MTEDEQAAFDADRRTGVTGTDAAPLLGISPWKSRYDVYCEKLGRAEPVPENERMYFGTLLQPLVAAEYARRTGFELEFPTKLLRHPTHEWLIGHIDARIQGSRRILEVKTSGTSIGWGEPGSDHVPLYHACQCHHYLLLTDALVCDIAVLIGGNDFRVYTIERNEDIAGMLLEAEHEFWHRHVLPQLPPEPVNTRDALRRWGRLANPGNVIASEADVAAVERLREIRNQRRELDAAEEAARVTVLKTLGEHGDTLVDLAGTPLASWRLDKGRAGYTVEQREPQRRFLIKD